MFRITLIIHTNTYFTGMLHLGLFLKGLSGFEPIFFFPQDYPTLKNDVENCRENNISVLIPTITKPQQLIHLPKKERYMKLLSSPLLLLKYILYRFFGNTIIWNMFQLHGTIKAFRSQIRKENMELVVLPADNRYDLAAYSKAAHLENIGVVVVPQFMAGPLEWAEYVWDQPIYQIKSLHNKLASVLFPRWKFDHKGRSLLALSGANVMAREWLDIAPPLPWVLHSGFSDVIAVESEAVKEYCINEGLPSHQLTVTGSIAHDILFDIQNAKESRRIELLTALEMDKNLPIVLSALPPDSLYMGRNECDFKSYHELVEFWCKSITALIGFNHVVVLHPSHIYDEMKYIEDYGLKIARNPTANIIPLCDIFVASISSTIQWATACGIPVINYDAYRYRYTDYANVDGVLTMEEKEEFTKTLHKLANDKSYYEKVNAYQQAQARRWGQLDGQASVRLHQLFLAVISKYKRENQYD